MNKIIEMTTPTTTTTTTPTTAAALPSLEDLQRDAKLLLDAEAKAERLRLKRNEKNRQKSPLSPLPTGEDLKQQARDDHERLFDGPLDAVAKNRLQKAKEKQKQERIEDQKQIDAFSSAQKEAAAKSHTKPLRAPSSMKKGGKRKTKKRKGGKKKRKTRKKKVNKRKTRRKSYKKSRRKTKRRR